MSTILLVDDEKNILKALSRELASRGYVVVTAQNGFEALDTIASDRVDLVMLDVVMPDMDGIEVLRKIKELRKDLPVIMMSAQGNIEMAVNATKLGAYHFIEKEGKEPELDRMFLLIESGLALSRLKEENLELREKLDEKYNMVGSSLAMQELYAQIQKAGPSDRRALIYGENGTGKELVAHAIHANSPRRDKPFIKVNCAAIPEELIESELFGHEKGSFTGAISQLSGKFELADGGTLFLDEVADMSLKTQAKVLRSLQEGEIERVGGAKPIKVDVRVISATNKNLHEEMLKGSFREDLYYRLNVIPIFVPPLREHKDDIPELITHFMGEFCKESGRKPKRFSAEATAALMDYDWPGNIRELKNVVERILFMVDHDDILAVDVGWALGIRQERRDKAKLPQEFALQAFEKSLSKKGFKGASAPLKDMVDESEKEIIVAALEANDWNVTRTAQQLRIERSHLYKKMQKYGIRKPDGVS